MAGQPVDSPEALAAGWGMLTAVQDTPAVDWDKPAAAAEPLCMREEFPHKVNILRKS